MSVLVFFWNSLVFGGWRLGAYDVDEMHILRKLNFFPFQLQTTKVQFVTRRERRVFKVDSRTHSGLHCKWPYLQTGPWKHQSSHRYVRISAPCSHNHIVAMFFAIKKRHTLWVLDWRAICVLQGALTLIRTGFWTWCSRDSSVGPSSTPSSSRSSRATRATATPSATPSASSSTSISWVTVTHSHVKSIRARPLQKPCQYRVDCSGSEPWADSTRQVVDSKEHVNACTHRLQ